MKKIILKSIKSKIFFALLFLIQLNPSTAQDTTMNTFKFFVIPVPRYFFLSLNLEQYLTVRNSLELTGKYYSTHSAGNDIYNNDYERMYTAVFSFRHYFSIFENCRNRNWISLYATGSYYKYQDYDYSHFTSSYKKGEENLLGSGFVLGRRMSFTKQKKLFFDIGLGMNYYFIRKETSALLPKVIFVMGYKS